ncbi:MAG: hypothetical protein KKA81_05075 [Bacteroidetes bacterium]|nr:hypothetical protein [Bacteroidota bacterium]
MEKYLNFLFGLVLLALLTYCERTGVSSPESDLEFSEYISAYTSGVVSRKSPVRVVLAFPLQITQDALPKDIITFNPDVKGQVILLNDRTIEFRPDKDFRPGTEYTAVFELGKIAGVSNKLIKFRFSFLTIEPALSLYSDGINTYDKTGLVWLSGYMLSSDFMNDKVVEKIVNAELNGTELKMRWTHSPDGLNHGFRIDSIPRKNDEQLLVISWDGRQENLDFKGKEEISVFPAGEFTVTRVSVVQSPEQYISIRFSDPLLKTQDLTGLVYLAGGEKLRYLVERNEIRAFPLNRESGSKRLIVGKGILNIDSKPLMLQEETELHFDPLKPEVRFLGKGAIMSETGGLILPFEAVNLKAVDVEIIRIFEDNIGQFFQVNRFDENMELKRVGRPVMTKKLDLVSDQPIDYNRWNRFSLDLTSLINQEPGAVYNIRFLFKRSYSMYPCNEATSGDNDYSEGMDWDDDGYYYWYYYPDNYNWYERDNPCDVSYYTSDRFPVRNILASNLGIIAKSGDLNEFTVAVTDILSTRPISKVDVIMYNYQNQEIAKAATDANGFANISCGSKPYLLVASKGKQKGYLRVDDGSSLLLSSFDIGGSKTEDGLKGFLYGERGVWRPGDTLFLNFILNKENSDLPDEHPVTLELLDPLGKLWKSKTLNKGVSGFYAFPIPLDPDAPTGSWRANVKVGGALFSKRLRVETIKPNRLKIDLNFNKAILYSPDGLFRASMDVKWLHGSPGKNLKASVEMIVSASGKGFDRFPDYVFNDPSKEWYPYPVNVYEGQTNGEGKAFFNMEMPGHSSAPGMLTANFVTKAFEPGGNFSINYNSIPYAPYGSFVGVKIPREKESMWLYTGTDYDLQIASVDYMGKPVNRRDLKISLFKVNWRWWWNASDDDLAAYFSSSSLVPYLSGSISTYDGKGSFTFNVGESDWGRYFVRVEDRISGHSCGQTIYFDWPGWHGNSREGMGDAAAVLLVQADKEKYETGENARISFPSDGNGRALFTLENGSGVIHAEWIDTREENTNVSFRVTPEMAPNVYAYVTLLQPHSQTGNDHPIRMYGVIPVMVEDANTILEPQIRTPEELKPGQEFTITVSEKNNRNMTYTIAMVDEGLLDLTGFKTPNPWDVFYAREALGVKTWDMFEYVLGAYGGRFEKIFSIGGDEELARSGKSRINRFKPVVKVLGPYTLKGKRDEHKITMPEYTGAVRFMVVAGNERAFGAIEKTVQVKSPLMVLATLPRVLGPDEEVIMPVSVFCMDKKIEQVSVKLAASEHFILDKDSQSLIFQEQGEKNIDFRLKVKKMTGDAWVRINAFSGNETAEYTINIPVRNPALPVTETFSKVIKAGEEWEYKPSLTGVPGTNSCVLEVSGIPPMSLSQRLDDLVSYPYGCTEQLVSSAFPQLFVGEILEVTGEKAAQMGKNVKDGISKIASRQLSNGGFVFWPGQTYADDWLTSYTGHFIMEAEKKGFTLPEGMKASWVDYQKTASDDWTPLRRDRHGIISQDDYIQAYRLFTLALAGSPQYGAMNRLRNYEKRSLQASWALAGAYAVIGQDEAASSLIKDISTDIPEYVGFSESFGSSLRDKALILMVLCAIDDETEAIVLFRQISDALSSGSWMSTQTCAFCLAAADKFINDFLPAGSRIRFDYGFDGQPKEEVSTLSAVYSVDFQKKGENYGMLNLINKGEGALYAQVTEKGIPLGEYTAAVQQNLNMNVVYKGEDGNVLDVSRLVQGTVFFAEVKVSNPGMRGTYTDMAISQVVASGWEVLNYRLAGLEGSGNESEYKYRDVRDDRVITFFDLPPGSKKFTIMLIANYPGRYYLPYTLSEAMYDHSIFSRNEGRWVEVTRE